MKRHWLDRHARQHGPWDQFVLPQAEHGGQFALSTEGASASTEAASGSICEPIDSEEQESASSSMVSNAMAHIDSMMFRHGQTNAQVGRAKDLASSCLQTLKPILATALGPHMRAGAEVGDVIDPLLDVFEQINGRRGEQRARADRSSQIHPPLKCYPRELGPRPALKGKRKCVDGVIAYVWEPCFEELMERELAYDPSFLTQLLVADQYWTARARELSSSDPYDPERIFESQADGLVWQSHEVLGDPAYSGPTRVALKGYGDDVDIPNGLGPGSGHSKLWIQTVTVVNRPPRSQSTMRAQFLSAVCLSSDFKIFGAHQIISGCGTQEYSLGATCRRLWTGGVLRLPPDCGLSMLPILGFLTVWTADGMAMGDICGTVTSFSKAVNPCNRCEDLDQRMPEKRKPCGFLRCRCGDAQEHQTGCSCHFRLRTPTRDAAMPALSKEAMQLQGRVTMKHALLDIPGIHVAHPGPKDSMHTLNEGRTSQLAAVTLWNFAKSGLATPEQLKRRASTFDWTPGGSSGFFRPNYIPDKIFVSTKIHQPDGSWVWGPHKDISLPFSAAGVTTFTLASTEFFRPFIPEDSPIPDWLNAWHLHAAGFAMTLRFRFKFSDLLIMEDHFVKSETLIQAIPAYILLWIPKAHWVLHLAHDIFLWGPSRLLTTLLNEMKNARFKAGAKRSNFLNPAKDVAVFWAQQSDYELQTLPLFSACTSEESDVIVTGVASDFPDSVPALLLLAHQCITLSTSLDFLKSFKLHGVIARRTDYVLLDEKVYYLSRIVRAQGESYYLHLHEVAESLSVDELGAYYIMHVDVGDHLPSRLLHVAPVCQATSSWSFHVGQRVYLVPKY